MAPDSADLTGHGACRAMFDELRRAPGNPDVEAARRHLTGCPECTSEFDAEEELAGRLRDAAGQREIDGTRDRLVLERLKARLSEDRLNASVPDPAELNRSAVPSARVIDMPAGSRGAPSVGRRTTGARRRHPAAWLAVAAVALATAGLGTKAWMQGAQGDASSNRNLAAAAPTSPESGKAIQLASARAGGEVAGAVARTDGEAPKSQVAPLAEADFAEAQRKISKGTAVEAQVVASAAAPSPAIAPAGALGAVADPMEIAAGLVKMDSAKDAGMRELADAATPAGTPASAAMAATAASEPVAPDAASASESAVKGAVPMLGESALDRAVVTEDNAAAASPQSPIPPPAVMAAPVTAPEAPAVPSDFATPPPDMDEAMRAGATAAARRAQGELPAGGGGPDSGAMGAAAPSRPEVGSAIRGATDIGQSRSRTKSAVVVRRETDDAESRDMAQVPDPIAIDNRPAPIAASGGFDARDKSSDAVPPRTYGFVAGPDERAGQQQNAMSIGSGAPTAGGTGTVPANTNARAASARQSANAIIRAADAARRQGNDASADQMLRRWLVGPFGDSAAARDVRARIGQTRNNVKPAPTPRRTPQARTIPAASGDPRKAEGAAPERATGSGPWKIRIGGRKSGQSFEIEKRDENVQESGRVKTGGL